MKKIFSGITVESPFDKSIPDNRNFLTFDEPSEVIAYMQDFLCELFNNEDYNIDFLSEETFEKFFSVSIDWVEDRIIHSASIDPLEYDTLEVESLAQLECLID